MVRSAAATDSASAVGTSARRRSRRSPSPILRKVIYDRPMQGRLVRDWLDGLSMLARARRRNPRQAKPRQLFDIAWATFNMFLSECLNCFKDPAYREEQEWRLIQFGRVNFQD